MADAESESPSEWYDDVLNHRRRLAAISSTDVVAVHAPPQDHAPSSIDVVAVLAPPQNVGTDAPLLGLLPLPHQSVPSASAPDSASQSSVTSAYVPLPSVSAASTSSGLHAFLNPALEPRRSCVLSCFRTCSLAAGPGVEVQSCCKPWIQPACSLACLRQLCCHYYCSQAWMQLCLRLMWVRSSRRRRTSARAPPPLLCKTSVQWPLLQQMLLGHA